LSFNAVGFLVTHDQVDRYVVLVGCRNIARHQRLHGGRARMADATNHTLIGHQ